MATPVIDTFNRTNAGYGNPKNIAITVNDNPDRTLMVFEWNDYTVSSMTWGAQNFISSSFQTGSWRSWYLPNPTATTQNVTATYAAGGAGSIFVLSLYNTFQGDPIRTGSFKGDNGSGEAMTAITSSCAGTVVNDLALDGLSIWTNSVIFTPSGSQTLIVSGNDYSNMMSYVPVVSTTTTMAEEFNIGAGNGKEYYVWSIKGPDGSSVSFSINTLSLGNAVLAGGYSLI